MKKYWLEIFIVIVVLVSFGALFDSKIAPYAAASIIGGLFLLIKLFSDNRQFDHKMKLDKAEYNFKIHPLRLEIFAGYMYFLEQISDKLSLQNVRENRDNLIKSVNNLHIKGLLAFDQSGIEFIEAFKKNFIVYIMRSSDELTELESAALNNLLELATFDRINKAFKFLKLEILK